MPVSEEVLDLALGIDPASPALQADKAIASTGADEETIGKAAAALMGSSVDEAMRIGLAMGRQSKYRHAVAVFRRIVALHPGSATAWEQLGINLDWMGEPDQAAEAFRKASTLDPLNASIQKSRAEFEDRRRKKPPP